MRPSLTRRLGLACALPLFWPVLTRAQSAPSPLLNYQGRVVVGSTNFSGTGAFKFALVSPDGKTTYWSDDGTSTGGSEPAKAMSLAVTGGSTRWRWAT